MAKGNCTRKSDGTIVYKTVSKSGSPPAELDSSKWYMDKCEIVGYRGEHLTITVNQDGIIRVDGDYNDGRASRSFFNEYIIPDGVNHEALEFRIYEADANTLVIVGGIGSDELVSAQQSSTITRTEDVRISSTFTETFESTELEGSEDISKEIRVSDNKFEATVNVSEYKSEEIQVRISRKVVLITSRKEVTKTSTRQEIKKTFEIPDGVKPESITSVVGKDGNLTVTAKVDQELARQQQLQKQIVEKQQTNTDEVLIRVRTVNTTKTVTGDDLKDVRVNKDRFEMNVDLREYKLEEVTVKIVKTRRIITISANHKSQYESRSTYREFTLPAGAPDSNPNAIDAVLSPNGILTITGPCSPQSQPAALTDTTDDVRNKVVQQQQQNTAVQQQQQNTSVKQQNTSVQEQQSIVQQKNNSVQQNTSVQQQNTSVQQHHKNTSVQQVQDSTVQQHQSQQEIVQKSRYTKITRATFTSSTMTSLDIAEANDDNFGEPLVSEPSTPIEDVTQDMVEDEDGNYVVELNIRDYRPEEITIKASKTTITVVGRKTDTNEEFCKTVHVPVGVVVTPDKIRSILDKSRRVITIIITKTTTVTTTEEQTKEQQRVDTLQQQKQQVQQKQESVQETQTKIQTQQQVNQQKQVQQKQRSIEETQTEVQTQQRINQQRQVQQKQESIEETETEVQTQQRINQQRQVQQKQDSIRETQTDVRTQQLTEQQKQLQQRQDQRQQNTTTTTTTSKRTLKTTTTTVESLKQLGYNFDSATSQVYTGDPKFFERATQIVDYKPEELEVKIAMPWVIIEGKQEMTAENGWRSKQFTKMFTVPEGVKQENIVLEMNDAGDVVNCTARIG
ncbi:interaptin-like isoform X2 [Bradysia coprophila]|uniref:interaptin-like isoform X2 n=1 Tax=Bradysia coprophila TaxID=38358 RepID=UPI00187D797E|nr:interaptin-like isoform X2 [Bradysia coprophila]